MIVAVLSDIHANLEALDAVLREASRRGAAPAWCLGDIVGYNADPAACLARVRERCGRVVRGNHDKAAAGLMDLDWFNPIAREAALWTRGALDPRAIEALLALPRGPRAAARSVLLCHGSPRDEDEYVVDHRTASAALRFLRGEYPRARICLIGHTHRPSCASLPVEGGVVEYFEPEGTIDLDPARVYLLNPGSVGQPRDGNPRASFGILDMGRRTFSIVRVAYPVTAAQRKILRAGLPRDLAQRLGEGL